MKAIPEFVKNNLYNLEYERESRGLSFKDLQKLTGVRADILETYERGTGTPTASKYNKLAEYFSWEEWDGRPQ